MKIPEYLDEIQHAVAVVMGEIYREQHEVERLSRELRELQAATHDGYAQVDFLALNPDLDDEGLGTAIYWDTYFGPDKDRHQKNAEFEQVVARVAVHEFSVNALCANLLQYAKQGLSLHFGKERAGCPDGRLLGGIPMHEVIWQARNQALHWEDGTFRSPICKCFDELALTADPVFAQYKHINMANEIVRYLGWNSPEDFTRDMMRFVS